MIITLKLLRPAIKNRIRLKRFTIKDLPLHDKGRHSGIHYKDLLIF